MLQKRYIAVVIVIIIFVLVIILSRRKNQVSIPQPTIMPTPTLEVTPIPTPSVLPKVIKPVGSTTSSVPGGTRGQITCDYQMPPAPGQFGSANIESNWNNIVVGKNGSSNVEICVFVKGTNSLMSEDGRNNGSKVDNAPWISLNSDYTFTLYDEHGGDLPDCGGVFLSSCRISTN
ncbi:MAG: hypothetical protein ABSE04_00495 [Candidatus Microgenomates bacterium]|jgi:hypothetical protein